MITGSDSPDNHNTTVNNTTNNNTTDAVENGSTSNHQSESSELSNEEKSRRAIQGYDDDHDGVIDRDKYESFTKNNPYNTPKEAYEHNGALL